MLKLYLYTSDEFHISQNKKSYYFWEYFEFYIARNVHVFDPLHVLMALYIVFMACPVLTNVKVLTP